MKKVKIEPGVFKSLSSAALDSAIDIESSPEKCKHAPSGSASQSLTQGLEEELRLYFDHEEKEENSKTEG